MKDHWRLLALRIIGYKQQPVGQLSGDTASARESLSCTMPKAATCEANMGSVFGVAVLSSSRELGSLRTVQLEGGTYVKSVSLDSLPISSGILILMPYSKKVAILGNL